jgi:hypothetical protein
MRLANLTAVLGNYLSASVRFFILACAIRNSSEMQSLKANLPMPLTVVHLTVPVPEIEKRLRSDVTRARQDDLRKAAEWIAASQGAGIEDLTIANDRPIRQVAVDILARIGWE